MSTHRMLQHLLDHPVARGGARSPRARRRRGLILLAAVAAAAAAGAAGAPAIAQNYESHVITIDSTTVQPVATGLIPTTAAGEIVILAEGNMQVLEGALLDRRWFGPAGCTRLKRAGQPVADMPFGALLGGFSTDIANYRYLGRVGAFHLEPGHVGREFRVALNLSPTDLGNLKGSVTVTVIFLADGWATTSQVAIDDTTTLPVPTGLVAAAGDLYLVLPYGALQPPVHPGPTEGYFAPEGMTKFNRAGQPYSGGPYGGLYGYFGNPGQAFYIGDGGSWRVLPGAVGQQLFLNPNLSAADLAGSTGRFVVNVVRIPQ